MSYTTATFARLERNADGQSAIVLAYSGDAGEPIIELPYLVPTNVMPTANYMRALAMARITALNNNLSFVTSVLPFVGTILDTTTPLPTPPATTYGMYAAASAPFTPGATPQDVFAISGSATKLVRVLRMALVSVQTSAGCNVWSLVKRSTANSGGTSALVPGVPTDDSYPAATATVRQCTANPTAGALVGAIWTGRIASPAPATAPAGEIGKTIERQNTPIATLSGITDSLAWNFGGAALPAGLSVQALVEWSEHSL